MNKRTLNIPDRYKPLQRGYVTACCELVNAPEGYVFGGESQRGTDCSGTVSYALTRCGYPIRLSADGFLDLIFTRDVPPNFLLSDLPGISALFVITEDYLLLSADYQRSPGDAIHMVPVVGNQVVLQADYKSNSIELWDIGRFLDRYLSASTYIVRRYLELKKLENWAWTKVAGLDMTLLEGY